MFKSDQRYKKTPNNIKAVLPSVNWFSPYFVYFWIWLWLSVLFAWMSLLLVRGNFEMWPALPDLSKSESICALNEGTLSAGCWVTKTTENYKTATLKDMFCSHNMRHFQMIAVFSQTFVNCLPFFVCSFNHILCPNRSWRSTELNI